MRFRPALRRPWLAVAVPLALLSLALGALSGPADPARGEIAQRGKVRVVFKGEMTPRALPRRGAVPVSVALGGKITTTNGSDPPQLSRVSIAVNRYGRLALGALPTCRIDQIQPSTARGAMEACGRSLVGEGRFSADVLLPEQAPFPSRGELHAFNAVDHGKPVILAHVYGTEPVPTSYTLILRIAHRAGTYGTVLSGSLPQATAEWGHVTGIDLTLGRTFTRAGKRQGFVSASCPAPPGFPAATFPLARTTFAFSGGLKLTKSLVRRCTVRD